MTSNRILPVVGFIGPSGSGKTTLLRAVVPMLRGRGLRVGYLKHSHHPLSVDRPGKDSQLVAEAGAGQVLLAAPDGWALMNYGPDPDGGAGNESAGGSATGLEALLARFEPGLVDLVLVEGLRSRRYAKIEVLRAAMGTAPLYPGDPDIIAVATDTELPPDAAPERLPLDDPTAVADFIQSRLTDGRLAGAHPSEELLRRCRELRRAAAEPRAGWLSVRAGERCWLARVALAGDDPGPDAVAAHPLADAASDQTEATDAAAEPESETAPDLATREAAIHRRIYSTQPRAGAIVGARMPYTAAVGFQGRSFAPLDPDGAATLGSVPTLSFDLDKLDAEAPAAIADALVDGPVCIIAGQGAYAWGADLTQALERAALLERSAQIYALGRQTSL